MKRTSVLMWALGIVLVTTGPAALAEGPPLVVDDNMVDCPNAEFTTIQAAVDAAAPGATIHVCAGTYHERVTITKDDLRLLAKGAPGDVVVDGDMIGVAALWVQDASGVRIEGFTVRKGQFVDILLEGARKARIRKNLTTAAGHDGIELFNSHDNLIEHNVSIHNPAFNACGINVVGGSTGNLIRHNLTVDNVWGIQIAGGTSANNTVFENTSVHNRQHGIRNIGAPGNVIENNRTFGNTLHGIGLHFSTGVVVARNHAFDNEVSDLFTDNAAANTFENNHCNSSNPPGLCDHDQGEGH